MLKQILNLIFHPLHNINMQTPYLQIICPSTYHKHTNYIAEIKKLQAKQC